MPDNTKYTISLADESAYNRNVPAYKYGGGDKSNLTIDLSGRATYNVDIGTTELSSVLREALWKSANLQGAILELPYIDVASVTLYALQSTGNTISQNTVALFLQDQVLRQNISKEKNTQTGKTYYVRTKSFDEENPLAAARRGYEQATASLKAKGYTK